MLKPNEIIVRDIDEALKEEATPKEIQRYLAVLQKATLDRECGKIPKKITINNLKPYTNVQAVCPCLGLRPASEVSRLSLLSLDEQTRNRLRIQQPLASNLRNLKWKAHLVNLIRWLARTFF